jgi:hypothetical protein
VLNHEKNVVPGHLPLSSNLVILSGAWTSRSEIHTESKDPYRANSVMATGVIATNDCPSFVVCARSEYASIVALWMAPIPEGINKVINYDEASRIVIVSIPAGHLC